MHSVRIAATAALMSLCLVSVAAGADEVWLQDGSRLIGTVTAIEGDVITLETQFAGTLSIQREFVRGLATESEQRFVFESGERVVGRLHWDAEGGQQIRSERAGAFAVAAEELVALEDPTAPVMQTPEQRAAAVWSSEVSLSVNGASGNTDQFGANPRFSALRETEFDRLRLGLQGRFASQDGSQTENEVIGTAGLERDFTDRWFVFGALRLERDELEDLDLRANVDLGAGYFVIRRDGHEFKPRAGLGVQTESFQNGESREDVVAVVGWDYHKDLNSRWHFNHVLDYRPTVSDPTGSYRVDSEAALVTVSNDGRWGLALRLRNEYNADPEPGVNELDTIYTVGIQRSFK
ncbi:MAG: DUF481 domain-containing protein [Wenzhouxiangellaceae bacterium]|nr:DUF481 domain-containing protein [Wenzhouxiangellaceae bacterium]